MEFTSDILSELINYPGWIIVGSFIGGYFLAGLLDLTASHHRAGVELVTGNLVIGRVGAIVLIPERRAFIQS